jgi:hypothetical protein
VGAQRPFGAAKHSERRCSEANRRRCARIDPGAKEPRAPASGPHVGASLFGYFFLGRHSGRLEKVTRRKGETLSGRYRSNGYVPEKAPTYTEIDTPTGKTIFPKPPNPRYPKKTTTSNLPGDPMPRSTLKPLLISLALTAIPPRWQTPPQPWSTAPKPARQASTPANTPAAPTSTPPPKPSSTASPNSNAAAPTSNPAWQQNGTSPRMACNTPSTCAKT